MLETAKVKLKQQIHNIGPKNVSQAVLKNSITDTAKFDKEDLKIK